MTRNRIRMGVSSQAFSVPLLPAKPIKESGGQFGALRRG